ncbi:MAG: outer membrane lipoprotein-sorting protein [Gammaproteobacteria bacterium]|nr:outer membrane lipoprotein-sorting protein [Gammaproteobacteria bacterium]
MRLLLLSLLLAHSLVTVAAEIPAAIEACMKENLPKTTSVQSIELRARDRSHYESVLQADVYLKRIDDGNSRLMMYFREPVDIRSARFLIVQKQPQNDMYIYMPGLFKVRRITSKNISSSIMGTDFSYEDFERLHGVMTDLRARQLPDEVLEGRPVYVLESQPDKQSGYTRVASYIDKESCIALKTDFYESKQTLRKQMTVDPGHLQNQDGIWYPAELLMKDFRDKTETRLKITNLDLDVELPDDLFDETRLKQADIPPASK